MEDILNFLKNRPSVETDEDIEYFLEKTETKSNQKFYRFFQFSCKFLIPYSMTSLTNQMGWVAKYSSLSERDHLGQEDAGAETIEPIEEYDVQIFYTRDQNPSQWCHPVHGAHLLGPPQSQEQAHGEAKHPPCE